MSNHTNLPLATFFVLISIVNGQTIEYNDNIVDSVRYGINLIVSGAYDRDDTTILLDKNMVDASSIRVFLHELGHHIWFNGGIDTTAILNDLSGRYFTRIEVLELFAEQHFKYFFNSCAPGFYDIFYQFYNRGKKWKTTKY